MRSTLCLLAVMCLAPIGCSSGPPALGEPAIDAAQNPEQLGEDWNEGQRLIEKGRALREKAQKLAVESEETLSEAEELIAEGTSMMSTGEESIQANIDLLRR